MLAEDFISRKRGSWERLSQLLTRAERGLSELSADELQELGRLYRQATSDLAVARRDFATHPLNQYLNGLVARGHSEVYRSKSARGRQFLRFFTHDFPRAWRATWPYSLAAFLMFFLPSVLAFALTYRDPQIAPFLVPGVEDVLSDIQAGEEWWQSINEEGRSASASLIMTNNIRVAFLAFAGGVLLGTLTLYVLLQNGLMLGTIAGAAQRFDFADNLWGFVAAHGVVELSVIFFAGGAGLQLGWSILRPGLLTRRASLVIATRRAITILFGCVPLLVIAGIIEGFISPAPIPVAIKYAVAIGSGVLLYLYLLRSGHHEALD
jgi:uncharacterized membrane protein SpoIIM required for sporulation